VARPREGLSRLSCQLLAPLHGLMLAKYVRRYSKGQKNDYRDAEASAAGFQLSRRRLKVLVM